jgi:hypothetical protein
LFPIFENAVSTHAEPLRPRAVWFWVDPCSKLPTIS